MKEKQRKVNCTDDSDSIYIKELIVPLEGNKIIECIDLEKETDIMTQLPLKEKIEEDLEIKKLPYILARLVTKHGRSYYKQYVDAEGLHQYLYNETTSIGRGTDRYRKSSILQGNGETFTFTNYINNLPIVNEIHYFTLDSFEKSFDHLCADYDLFVDSNMKRFFQLIFRASDILVPGNKMETAAAQFNLGLMYRDGQGVEQDYKKALEYFEVIANQEHDLSAKTIAQFNLGLMYRDGLGVEQNYKKALEYFEVTANQDHDLYSKAIAQFNLGLRLDAS